MRGIYGKFLLTVTAVIVVGFVLLALILSAEAKVYSDGLMAESARSAAWSVRRFVLPEWHADENLTLAETLEDRRLDTSTHKAFADGMVLFFCDTKGNLLVTPVAATSTAYEHLLSLPAECIAAAMAEAETAAVPMEGVAFDTPTSYLLPLANQAGEVEGYVLTVLEDPHLLRYTNTVVTTILLTSLLVLVASLVVFFTMSGRTIGPLKRIGVAARQFAAGHLDVRVPEGGTGEIADLARSFNRMAESLSQTDDLRRAFLSNVSHDLRTPMTTISGFVEGILDGTIPPEKHKEYLTLVAGEVRRLSRLVNSLLDVTRLQSGERKFHAEPFDVCEMARQILISFEKRIEAKNLQVEFLCEDDTVLACADHDAIYQVLYNLCDNAVKFAKEDGVFSVEISTDADKRKVRVYNQGAGIAEADLPHLFDRFYKADKSRGLDTTGVGLGLYICKTILQSMGEEITVESTPGADCAFTFTLPIA